MRTCSVPALGAIIVMFCSALVNSQVSAEIHHQRARVRCCLPLYDYADDHSITAGRLIFELKRDSGQLSWPRTRSSTAADGSLVPFESSDQVRRKKFSPPPTPLVVGPVRLDKMGVVLYDTGDIKCTGRIVDESPADGKPRGVNTTIIVRAYAGIPETEDGRTGATMLWRQAGQLRARNGLASTESLLPYDLRTQSELRRHFDEITHLEIELRYHKGR